MDALIAKVRKTAWPRTQEELENINWLFEQLDEFESPTLNRLAHKNRDDVSEQLRQMPLVKLMSNSPETENTLVKTDNALGLRFKLFGKRSGEFFIETRGPIHIFTLSLVSAGRESTVHRSLARVCEPSTQSRTIPLYVAQIWWEGTWSNWPRRAYTISS